ncbi:GntR family transcriptional regulator [Pseudomonas putida S11]|nr:GntR family transcriptional regulator [Pseudomonas putida S11]
MQQLTDHLQTWIGQQRLRPGARLPSIRALARSQAVSASCVIEAYDRLVANGWLGGPSRHRLFRRRAQTRPGRGRRPTLGRGQRRQLAAVSRGP